MDRSQEEFAVRYASLSEEELQDLAQQYESLTGAAQFALRTEFAKRGLESPVVPDPVEFDVRKLVTVNRYRDLAEGIVARSYLESAGIAAWLCDENLVRIDWGYSYAIGGMRLQVNAQDEWAAIEILSQMPASIPYAEGVEYVQPQCSQCGSTDLGLRLMTNLWVCGACGAHGMIVENDEDDTSA